MIVVIRGPYEIGFDATYFEDIQSGVGTLVRCRAQGGSSLSFSQGITRVRLLTVVVIPIIPYGGMDRKPVLHAHRCSVPEWMIVAIWIAFI